MELGPATVRWNDYVGTAAADDADARGSTRSLYELSGLDRDRWTIVGMDLAIAGARPRVTVYAVDRVRRQVTSAEDIAALAAAHGGVPVTAFPLSGPTEVEEFLNDAFAEIVVRLVSAEVRSQTLRVDPGEHTGRG